MWAELTNSIVPCFDCTGSMVSSNSGTDSFWTSELTLGSAVPIDCLKRIGF